jgi:hypothetical protein
MGPNTEVTKKTQFQGDRWQFLLHTHEVWYEPSTVFLMMDHLSFLCFKWLFTAPYHRHRDLVCWYIDMPNWTYENNVCTWISSSYNYFFCFSAYDLIQTFSSCPEHEERQVWSEGQHKLGDWSRVSIGWLFLTTPSVPI